MPSINDVIESVSTIKDFVSDSQLEAMSDGVRGEEAEFFKTLFVKLAERINTMPKTYEQDGKGDEAVVYLHYFRGNMDWYVTEKDSENEQLQAFGLADLGMGFPEMGYISIQELIENGIELDIHWTPKTLGAVKVAV